LEFTPAISHFFDRNTWSVLGPGARIGLNRLVNVDKSKRGELLREMLSLFERRHSFWPPTILGQQSEELYLSDIQFQLCEFGKYVRKRNREPGSGRPYVPALSSNTSSAPY